MDNAQKAIMIGVGLFITIIIIAAVMLITGMGQDLMNSGTQQLSQVSSQLQASLTQEYDGKLMTGAQVLAAIKRYHADPTMIIMVDNGKGFVDAGGQKASAYTAPSDAQPCYILTGAAQDNTPNPVGWYSTPGKNEYVQTTSRYNSYVMRIATSTGDVAGIVFKLK